MCGGDIAVGRRTTAHVFARPDSRTNFGGKPLSACCGLQALRLQAGEIRRSHFSIFGFQCSMNAIQMPLLKHHDPGVFTVT
eukprot:scaffold24519_cov53-Attheya_sp.AAC.5